MTGGKHGKSGHPGWYAVLTVLTLLHCPAAQAVASQSPPARRSVQPQKTQAPPPGWSDTLKKTLDMTLEGKHSEVIAIYENWVAKYPNFAEAHMMLAGAHEALAKATLLSRSPDAANTSTKHFESAAVHGRRAIELEGSASTFMTLRSLIDLYGRFGLNRPAEYERLVREGLARYPAEPLAHAYLIALVASKREPIDNAVRAARAAIPKSADARSELAGALAAFARDDEAVASPLLTAALGLVDEALKMNPSHVDALEQKGRIQRALQNRRR
jgi:hypothetical protein